MRLYINSEEGIYRISLNRYIKLVILWVKEEIVLQTQLFLFEKKFYPMRPSEKNKKPVTEKGKKSKTSIKTFSPNKAKFRLVINMIKTFKVKELKVSVDTDNYIANAYLFPFFYRLSNGNRQLKINYNGDMKLVVDMRNNLYSIIKTFLSYKFNKF